MKLPKTLTLFVKAFWAETDAQDLVEYSLLLGFVSITAIAMLTSWKSSLTTIWSKVTSDLAGPS
jgi:Flp pilus assembly pilin Flp